MVRSKRYPAENITEAGYADDLALLVNRPVKVESLQHNLGQTVKPEFMRFKEDGSISIYNGKLLKWID